MNPISKSRFYFRFALISATGLTALTLLLNYAARFSGIIGTIFRFLVTIPWVTTWILEAEVYTRHPYPEGGTMESMLARVMWVFIFMQWFIVSLAIAFVFRLIRLMRHHFVTQSDCRD